MSIVFNLKDHPEIIEVLNNSLVKLIEQTDRAGYINPELEVDIQTDDKRTFKLLFERTDLD